MYGRFSLVLMLNHACNLNCTYCYTGNKFNRPMPAEVGRRAIDRALASLAPNGVLELGFFGGEPLLEHELLGGLLGYAKERATSAGNPLSVDVTTNGTVTGPEAWAVLARTEIKVAVSHDGLPEIHDQHRRSRDGRGTSAIVLETIERLIEASRDFDVVMVVRPDTVSSLPDGISYLRAKGVRHVQPSLDLWTTWRTEDLRLLEKAIAACAVLWRDGLPDYGISWFDEKAARLGGVLTEATVRCGFGDGAVAVAPSARMYPCERLIGDDSGDKPMRLPEDLFGQDNFLVCRRPPSRATEACSACEASSLCATTCRCSNYVRTGDVRKPDLLLCTLDKACLSETAKAFRHAQNALSPVNSQGGEHERI